MADFEKPVLAEHGPQLPLRPPHLSFVYHSPRPCPLSGRRLEVIYINGAQANSKDRGKGIAGRSSKTENRVGVEGNGSFETRDLRFCGFRGHTRGEREREREVGCAPPLFLGAGDVVAR